MSGGCAGKRVSLRTNEWSFASKHCAAKTFESCAESTASVPKQAINGGNAFYGKGARGWRTNRADLRVTQRAWEKGRCARSFDSSRRTRVGDRVRSGSCTIANTDERQARAALNVYWKAAGGPRNARSGVLRAT